MVKAELIKRSPLRILEKSIHGGVGKGNLAVVAARKGVGKTAFLVHLATDQLFQDKHVIHVSFSANTQHIIDWYEDIFNEITRRFELDSAMKVHDELIKNRIIMNFNQTGIPVKQVVKSLKAMIKDGCFSADLIIVDGFNFEQSSQEDIMQFKQFAEELGLEIWFSASLKEPKLILNKDGIPPLIESFIQQFSILILLIPQEGFIHIKLIKDHDLKPSENMHLKLDPKILLIAREE
jgi:hypothetical protein